MNLPLIVFVASCFGLWPIMARYAALPASWTNLGIGVATMVVTAIPVLASKEPIITQNARFPAVWMMTGLVLLAGAVNGIGLTNFGKVYLGANAAAGLAATFVLMILITTVASYLFFGDHMNTWKVAGIFSACVTVWLLNHP